MWIERRQGVSSREWIIWTTIAISLLALAVLHVRMDGLLDSQSKLILDSKSFRLHHTAYLTISTAQWLASLVLLALALRRWRVGHN